ncbi:MAG: FHA domain-containing protein [Planctomycetota bacterium]
MATLTLTEGGASRRFKLTTGKATVGSGPDASLQLSSDDVAALHGEFEMTEEGLVLRTAKGVLPPTAGGHPVPAEYVLEDGVPLQLGDAILAVTYDEGEGPAPKASAPAVRATPVVKRAGASGGARRVSARRRDGDDEDDDDRPRRRVQRKSDPSGILLGAVVLIGLLGAGYWVVSTTASGLAGQNFDFENEFRRARRKMEEDSSPLAARRALESILKEDITPAQRKDVTALLTELQGRSAETSSLMANSEGTKWFERRLQTYMDRFPVTRERGFARAFLSRADYFLERWPNHPEEGRLRGMMDRVASVAETDEPMTTDDLETVVASWADTKPPEFYEAYELLDDFARASTDEFDLQQVEYIRAQTAEKEQAYYDSQLKKAKAVYTKQGALASNVKPGQAYHDLASVIARCQDAELKADAARRMLLISEVGPKFVRDQYQVGRPLFWERMVAVPSFEAWAREQGML